MQIESYGMTDRGKVREENEDAFLVDREHQLFAVADGLGGIPGGAEASQRSIDLLAQSAQQADLGSEGLDLAQVMIRINASVAREGFENHPFTGNGSTLTIAHIVADTLRIGHVGDSAVYLLRSEKLDQLTIDHTQEQDWIDQHGEAARDQMDPRLSHTLTQCIGQDFELRIDTKTLPLLVGDQLLLCTDGLNKVLADATMRAVLQKSPTPESACRELIQLANENEGPDNITALVVRIS
ncbi:MAG: serine/threonine-protein phosphatase [Puniceicoccaceae bacterium]|nr:MAG: serine/threonine-protein phosphatase [Puniceicoccaceae bacterium]